MTQGTQLQGTSLPCSDGGVRIEFATDQGTYIGNVRIFATNPSALLVMLDETRKFIEASMAAQPISILDHQHGRPEKPQ